MSGTAYLVLVYVLTQQQTDMLQDYLPRRKEEGVPRQLARQKSESQPPVGAKAPGTRIV